MNGKRVLMIVLAALLIASIAGCASAPTPAATPGTDGATAAPSAEGTAPEPTPVPADGEKKVLKIAWLVDSVDMSLIQYQNTTKAWVDWYNAKSDEYFIEYSEFDGQRDVNKQIADIETAVAKGVDAIILACVDPDGIRSSAQQAVASGVKVIEWRGMGGVNVTYEGAAEPGKGKKHYEWIKKYLDDNPDKTLNALLMQGASNYTTCFPRMEALFPLEKEYPDRFKIVDLQYGDWITQKAMSITEDWLQAYSSKDINFISAANEEMLIGVAEVLKQEGALDKFLLTTFNGESPGIELIRAGECDMDVGTVLPIWGAKLMETTLKMLVEGFEGHVDMSADTIYTITPANLDEYEKMLTVDYDSYYSKNPTDIIGLK